MQETWVQSLGWEDPPEEGKALQYYGLENSMHFPHIGIHNYYAYTTGSILEKDTHVVLFLMPQRHWAASMQRDLVPVTTGENRK